MEGITSPPMGQLSSGSIFSPLLISMLGIIGTSIAILFYHFFLVRFCMRRHNSSSSLPNTAAETVHPPPTGIDQKVLQNIPIYTFSAKKHEIFVVNQIECVVCLGELEDEDLIRCLPSCKHVFHVECIDQWLQAHVSCPLCRSKIAVELENEMLNEAVLTDEIEIVDNDDDHDDDSDLESSSNRSDTVNTMVVQSCGLLRHCASLVLTPPGDRRSRLIAAGLKRSLSMDQSFIAINLQREDGIISGGGELRRSGSGTTRSVSQFDRLLRSFSRLRIGKGNNSATTILPY